MPMTGRAHIHRSLVLVLALAALTLAVFWPITLHDFLIYDDAEYVAENPVVREGLTARGLRWAFSSRELGNWHPLTWIAHMADVQLFGLRPGWHHAVNLLLHLANTLLLFLTLRAATGALGRSALAAALFAVHPLHVESVAWISERKDVLSGFFWLLTLAAYLWHARGPSRLRYAGVALCFLLGLSCKPMLVTVPLTLLVIDAWPLGRFQPAAGAPRPASKARALLEEKLPLLALSALFSAIAVVAQRRGGAFVSLDALPPATRLGNAVVSLVTYLGKTLWPAHLAVFYPYRSEALLPGKIAAAAALLFAITAAAVVLRRQRPWLIVGWLWFLLTMVPVIGIIQVGEQAMADRYTYMPLVGIFVAASWGAAGIASRTGLPRGMRVLAAAGLVAVLAAAARAQVETWRDSETLFRHALAATGRNWLAEYNLGLLRERRGDLAGARALYLASVRDEPINPKALNNLGVVAHKEGNREEARAHYLAALAVRPDHPTAHGNLGVVLLEMLRVDEAIGHLETAARLLPEDSVVRYNLAVALEARGDRERAKAGYLASIRIDPGNHRARNNLGAILMEEGRLDDALGQFGEALRLRPDYATAHYNRGRALARRGMLAEAAAAYRRALAGEPNLSAARVGLEEALRHAAGASQVPAPRLTRSARPRRSGAPRRP